VHCKGARSTAGRIVLRPECPYQALRVKAHRCAAAGLDRGSAAERCGRTGMRLHPRLCSYRQSCLLLLAFSLVEGTLPPMVCLLLPAHRPQWVFFQGSTVTAAAQRLPVEERDTGMPASISFCSRPGRTRRREDDREDRRPPAAIQAGLQSGSHVMRRATRAPVSACLSRASRNSLVPRKPCRSFR
jgi:hypothetical protein